MSFESTRVWLGEHAPDLRMIDHGVSTATVREAAAALGVEEARIAKTLALRFGDRIILLLAAGDSPPSSWSTERRGNLQRHAGFQSIRIREFAMPASTSPSPTLQLLAQNLGFPISNADRRYRIDLEMTQSNGQLPVVISLP